MNKFSEHGGHVRHLPRDRQEEGRRGLGGVSDTAESLQVTFRYRAGEPSEQLTRVLKRTNVNAPGCLWKTWLTNRDGSEASVIYLFEDGASLGHFLKGPVINDLRYQEGVSDVSVRTGDAVDEIQVPVTQGLEITISAVAF